MKKIVSILLVLVMVLSLSACGNNEKFDNYSKGLDENGLYEGFEPYAETSKLLNMQFTYDEVLEWGVTDIQSTNNKIKTVDDYVYYYGNELIAALDLAHKDECVDGDFVTADLKFYFDGKLNDEFTTTRNYEAAVDGDSIVSSFIGHKTNDEYEVEYTFPDDDPTVASKTAVVKIKITDIYMSDPIAAGLVEANIKTIAEYLGAKEDAFSDKDTFLAYLKPLVAEAILSRFVSYYIVETMKVNVPTSYIDSEMYRFKYRLNQLGYSYENGLTALEMTEQESIDYCTQVAQENYLLMSVYSTFDTKIDDSVLKEYYGDNLTFLIEAQGKPYMILKVLKEIAIQYMVSNATLA